MLLQMESHPETNGDFGYSPNSLNGPSGTNGSTSYASESPRQVTGTASTSAARSVAASRRSRWGCNTCRKRKVKCDEIRPVCGHCIRLNLVCDYDSVAAAGAREYTPRRQQRPRQRSGPAQQTSSPLQRAPPSPGITSPWAGRQEQRASAVEIPQDVNMPRDQSVGFDTSMPGNIMPSMNADMQLSDQMMQLSGPDAWELELLGEDSLWANLPILSNFMSVQESESYGTAAGSNGTRAALPTASYVENENSTAQNLVVQETSSNAFALTDEITLLRHFVDFAVPPILVGVEPRWNSSRDALLRLSKSSLHLRHAICAFSALSLGESPSSMPFTTAQSSTYYSDLAMSELRKQLDENEVLHQHLGGQRNKSRASDGLSASRVAEKSSEESILATIFFLSYIELIVSNAPKTSLELLNRAHLLMSSKEQPPGTTLYHQLQIWLKLLDAKVVSAGGEGVHLHTNPSTRDLEGVPNESYDSSLHANSEPPNSTTANNDDDDDNNNPPNTNPTSNDIRSPVQDPIILESSEILFNALNRRPFAFYLQALNFSGRIARLDKWHRPRGTVADELAVMLAADKISRDLAFLWTRRPPLLDLADQHARLRAYLSPSLATRVELHLRTYAAGFHACFIHLQRVAYAHLQATEQVREAVRRIVRLTRLTVEEQMALPASLLWPLMMAACEAEDEETSGWIIACIEGMEGGGGAVGNARRTAGLVREIVKRQRSGVRADARTVMQESFGQVFAII